MSEFYGEIVENLKKEAIQLNERLLKVRENHNMNDYIATLKSLRETLNLVQQYDWQLMYSEYGVPSEDYKQVVTEIAVWEQNHEGEIRNHKKWATIIPYKKGMSIRNSEGEIVFHHDNNGLTIRGNIDMKKHSFDRVEK